MSERSAMRGCALPRWQIPDLDGAAEPGIATAPPRMNGAGIVEAEARVNGAAAPNGAAVPDDSAAPNGAAEQPPPASDIIAEEIARGRAEGIARGLLEGREEGYAEGLAAGTKAAEEALAAQAQRLAAIAEWLGGPIPALERAVEEAVAALALEIARCVIGDEVARSRDYLVRLIREAIAKVPIEMGALQLVLNPADVELVRALAPDIESGGAVLVGDASVEAGGCLVVADGDGKPVKDRRWRPRAGEGVSQVDLTLAARWRGVMLALFDGEEE